MLDSDRKLFMLERHRLKLIDLSQVFHYFVRAFVFNEQLRRKSIKISFKIILRKHS